MILALDLATNAGWCCGLGDDLPEVGHVTMPDTKEEVGPFLSFFQRWLQAMILEHRPTYVVFEAPMLPKARFDRATGKMTQAPTTIATTRKLQGLAGVCEMVVFDLNFEGRNKPSWTQVEVREVFLQTVKKELAGSGRAEKPDMMRAAKRCGVDVRTYDEADAFGVWLVSVRHYAKTYQHIWDQKLFGGRGLV